MQTGKLQIIYIKFLSNIANIIIKFAVPNDCIFWKFFLIFLKLWARKNVKNIMAGWEKPFRLESYDTLLNKSLVDLWR